MSHNQQVINIYLDDLRPCPKGFVLAKNAEECIRLLRENKVDVMSMDHDLGWDEMNGTDLAHELVRLNLYANEIYLHSSSMIGRQNMYKCFMDHKPDHVKVSIQPPSDETYRRIANQN
jgi:hypothetical protein